MVVRRMASSAALILALASVTLGVLAVLSHVTRALLVLVLVLVALGSAWWGVLHRGAVRAIAALVAARTAFKVRVHLAPLSRQNDRC